MAHALLSLALSASKRAKLGLQAAEAALACAPNAVAFQAKSIALRNLGRHKQALDAAREAARLSPQSAAFAQLLGMTLEKRGKIQEAKTEFARAVSLAPGNDSFAAAYGLFLLRNRQLEAAEQVAAPLSQSDDVIALLLRGNIAIRRHRPEEARDLALWVLSEDAVNQSALTLLVSAKAAQSRGMGLWWRYHVFVAARPKWVRLGIACSFLVLLMLPPALIFVLPVFYYLSISRQIFARMVMREVKSVQQNVRLKKGF